MKRFEGDNSERKHSDENRTRNVLHGIGRLELGRQEDHANICFVSNTTLKEIQMYTYMYMYIFM